MRRRRAAPTQAGAALGSVGGALAGQAVTIVVGLVSGLVDLFLVLIIALYLLLDVRRIRTGLLRVLPKRWREQFESVEVEVVRVFGAYVGGQLILAVIGGAAATIDRHKQERLVRAARSLLQADFPRVRIDVVAIDLDGGGARLTHHRNAVTDSY